MKIETPPIIERMRDSFTLTSNRTTEKEGKEKENSGIDYVLLDKISNEYIVDKHAFNDIPSVEQRITELTHQQQLSTNTETTKKIANLLLTYEIQNKYLLQLKVEDARKKNGTIQNHSTTGSGGEQNPIEIDLEDQSTMSGITYDNNNTNVNNKKNFLPSNKNEDTTTPNTNNDNNKPNSINNKRKGTPSTTTSPSRKSKIENPYINKQSIPGNKNGEFKTANEVKLENKEHEKEVKSQSKIKSIRLRVQFTVRSKGEESLKIILQNTLFQLMQYAKTIDIKTSLLPWKLSSK